MSTWNVYVQSSGEVWTLDGTISRPQESMEMERVSTQQQSILITGDTSFMTPETKTLLSPVTFVWYEQAEALKTQLEEYMTSNDYIKITTHIAKTFIGRFTSVRPMWLTGRDGDFYDIFATFTIGEE